MSIRLTLRILVCVVLKKALANDIHNHECDKLGILLYEDLGCTPVIKEGAKCPSKFTCGSFERSSDSCLFHSKKVAVQEQLKDDDTYASCNIGCFCRKDEENEKPDFTCAILDCPEWLGSPIEPGCYRKYELGKCCSVGQNCPPFDNIKTCKVEDKDYREGERFTPANTCLNCVCQKKFTGDFDKNTCIRQQCAAQLRHSQDIENNCAPAYFKFDENDVLCCPSDWICPNTNIKIKKINPNAQEDPELTCKFGKSTLQLGEGFEKTINQYGSDRRMKCECSLPPLVTCKQVS